MGRPAGSLYLLLCLTATLPAGPLMVHAEGGSVSQGDTSTSASTSTSAIKGEDNQCSPLQRRLDLLDNRMTERDTDINTRLNGIDAKLNSRLNGLDARLNRMDGRFDDMETAMSDMKEFLQQRLDAMEVKAELALTATTHKKEVSSQDNQPNRTSPMPKDCQEAYTMGSTSSGIYTIALELNNHMDVYCEQELDGGGWIVFQLRKDGSVDFFRDWKTYKDGFGELTGEFWLGNQKIHLLTKQNDYQLKIEMTSPEGAIAYMDYTHFWIENEAQKFRLNVTGYSGGSPALRDSLAHNNGHGFSTSDQDNDRLSGSCATSKHGAWWYWGCSDANLNGRYGGTGRTGVYWFHWKEYKSLKTSRMMVRRRP